MNTTNASAPAPFGPPAAYLTTSEAADYIRVTKRWLEKLRQIGGGPPYCKPGLKKILYRRDDLDEWVARSKRQNTSQPPYSGRPE